tara:strand:- start:8051 stop:8293 length:243 start_codon:yes stop_codon:yes gene_type:complete
VAILAITGPTSSSRLSSEISKIRPDYRASSYSVGFILTKTHGVIKIRDRPSAIWDLDEDREAQLPAATHEKVQASLQFLF